MRHNHLRQHCLKLEKKWVTHNPCFCLATTVTGMNVVDTYRLACFHSLLPSSRFKIIDIDRGRTQNDDIDGDSNFMMKRFAEILSKQLLIMSESLVITLIQVIMIGRNQLQQQTLKNQLLQFNQRRPGATKSNKKGVEDKWLKRRDRNLQKS